MRAFAFDAYKQPLHEILAPEPTVGDHDVLVQVAAAGLNHLDAKIREGEFKLILPYKAPLVLGHDVAGTVIEVGGSVRSLKPGDEVFARPRDHRSAPSPSGSPSTKPTSLSPRRRSASSRPRRCPSSR